MTGTGEDKMKSRGARYLILAFLSVQLIAAMTIGRPVEAHPRTHRSNGVVLLPNASSYAITKELPAGWVHVDSPNVSDDLKHAQLNSGILLNGRTWNMTLPNDGLRSLNPFVSNGDLSSNCRAFFVGHLIKNALQETSRRHPARSKREIQAH